MSTGQAVTTESGKLRRRLGFWAVAALVLNGIVGAGVFAFPAAAAVHGGGLTPLIVLGVGALFLPIVVAMGLLARLFDGTGGPILYVDAAFGRAAAFQIGWMSSLSSLLATAANANVLADYLLALLGADEPGLLVKKAIVLGALTLVLIVNLRRVEGVGRALELASIGKLVPLFLLVALALPTLVSGGAVQPPPGGDLVQAALVAAFAFVGFEGALTVAGEARRPERDLPRAMVAVFGAVTLLYACLCWAYVTLVFEAGKPDPAPLSSLAVLLIGSGGALLVAATAIVSIFGNVALTALAVSRRFVALADLGTAPAWLGRVEGSAAIPRGAVLTAFAIAVALALSGGFVTLALISVASRLVVYLSCLAAWPVILRQRGLRPGLGDRLWWLAGLFAAGLLILGTSRASWLMLAGVVAVGTLIYMTQRGRARDPVA